MPCLFSTPRAAVSAPPPWPRPQTTPSPFHWIALVSTLGRLLWTRQIILIRYIVYQRKTRAKSLNPKLHLDRWESFWLKSNSILYQTVVISFRAITNRNSFFLIIACYNFIDSERHFFPISDVSIKTCAIRTDLVISSRCVSLRILSGNLLTNSLFFNKILLSFVIQMPQLGQHFGFKSEHRTSPYVELNLKLTTSFAVKGNFLSLHTSYLHKAM